MHVVHKKLVDGSSMIRFPLVIADETGMEPWPPEWHTRALTTELLKVYVMNITCAKDCNMSWILNT